MVCWQSARGIYSKKFKNDENNAAQQDNGRRFHIFTATFQFKKLEKQDFSDNEFSSATGDILEMQQGIFMN